MGSAAQLPGCADSTLVGEDARSGEPGIPLGGGVIAPTWVSQVGAKRAKELALIPGNHVTGAEAAAWGWANAAVPADRLVACAEALAERMALIPAPVLAMKKLPIKREKEAQRFPASVTAIVDSSAILHRAPSALRLRRG